MQMLSMCVFCTKVDQLMFPSAETNLKKQGMLPLIFANPSDYDKIQPTDRISLLDMDKFAPGKVSIIEL